MAVKTQPPSQIATGDNAPNMGTTGADPITGAKADQLGNLSVADPGTAAASAGTNQTQLDINDILAPYIKEMTTLGPEYGAEMEYLKPYLEGTGAGAPQTFAGLQAQSKANESPTGDTAVSAAEDQVGKAIENAPAPGFGEQAQATQEFEQTVPYSQLLQTVLGAGKNEILYGTVPNISNISTAGWPQSVQEAYSALAQSSTGTNPASGLQSPTQAAQAAQKQAAQQAGGIYNTQPSGTGGGNVG